MSDTMIQDAVVRNLEIIGEASKALSNDVRVAHPEIPWSRMAGMRDVLIHQYMGIDLSIVWDVVEHRLDGIEAGIAKLAQNGDA